MQTEANGRVIEELSSLLRRELASVTLYEEALEELRAAGTPLAESLREMSREHARNARTLRTEICRVGGTPLSAAGAFSALALAGETGRSGELVEEDALVSALLSCELRALRTYEEAARRLPGAIAALVREVLVPARRRHLAALRSLSTYPLDAVSGPGHADCTSTGTVEGTGMSPKIKEVSL